MKLLLQLDTTVLPTSERLSWEQVRLHFGRRGPWSWDQKRPAAGRPCRRNSWHYQSNKISCSTDSCLLFPVNTTCTTPKPANDMDWGSTLWWLIRFSLQSECLVTNFSDRQHHSVCPLVNSDHWWQRCAWAEKSRPGPSQSSIWPGQKPTTVQPNSNSSIRNWLLCTNYGRYGRHVRH